MRPHHPKKIIALMLIVGIAALIGAFALKNYNPSLGSGNLALYTSVSKADICKTTDNTTSTCSFLNNDPDQKSRWISEIRVLLDGTDGSTGSAATFKMGTTTASTISVPGTGTAFAATTLTTSTAPIYLVTSTYATPGDREWPYNTYLNAEISTATVSSTEGWVAVIYNKEPAQ